MVRHRATSVIPPPSWGAIRVLPENRAAIRAAQRIAAGRASAPSLLLLHGPPGVGKSAIVSALVTEYLDSPLGHIVRHISAAELPRKSRPATDAEAREIAEADLLIIEDLQHLPARDVLPLCQLLDERAAHRRPVVMTATSGPAGLTAFARRLTNRLAAGLVVRVEMPGLASRRKLVEDFADARQVRLTSEAIDWMARAADGVRPLIGFVEKLKPVMKGYAEPLSAAQVQEWLIEPTVGETKSRLHRIVSRVAAAYQVKPKEVLGPSRLRTVLLPRQVAMALARDLTQLPLAEIGKHFGGRDHSTVLHAVRKIEALAGTDATLAGRLKELRAELE